MSSWKILHSIGGLMGFVLLLVASAALVGGLALLLRMPIQFLSFALGLTLLLALVAIALIGYWTYGYYTLVYILDRDALRISWAGFETVVPLTKIRSLADAADVPGRVRLPWLRWPGYRIGRGEIVGLGPVMFFASQPRERQVLVVTDGLAYAISPADAEGFARALELRQSLGVRHELAKSVDASPFLSQKFWSDPLAQVIWGFALFANLALFAYLCAAFPSAAPVLPFHFDALGDVDRLAPAVQVFALPGIGALGLLANGLIGIAIHARQRTGTLLLWGGTVVIQGYLWLAVLGILGRSL